MFFKSTADMFDENVSGSRNASSISVFPLSTTPTPSTGITGIVSRSILNIGCGLAAVSGSIPANGLSSPPVDSVTSVMARMLRRDRERPIRSGRPVYWPNAARPTIGALGTWSASEPRNGELE